MKKTQSLKPRPKLSLGDLIVAVSSCTKSTTETVATVADLLASGQVRLESNGRAMRAEVCYGKISIPGSAPVRTYRSVFFCTDRAEAASVGLERPTRTGVL